MPLPPSLKRKRLFQHTAARRRLGPDECGRKGKLMFQHTAARRRLGLRSASTVPVTIVSTHSRPKAAGSLSVTKSPKVTSFQHTAARRRLGKRD